MSKPGGSKAQRKRAASAAAAKERRQKVIAFGGLGVLAILLVIQGPRMLDLFGGSSEPVARSAEPVVVAPEEEPEDSGQALRALQGGGDPFAASGLADHDPQAGPVSGPGGLNDPFASGAAASSPAPSEGSQPAAKPEPAAPSLPNQIVLGTPTAGAVGKRGWIVVLASIQTRLGRDYAERFATRVQANGLDVAVLNSSTNKPLRAGYYVVYTGPFASLDAVQRSASHVRAFGYRTAYVREILRY